MRRGTVWVVRIVRRRADKSSACYLHVCILLLLAVAGQGGGDGREGGELSLGCLKGRHSVIPCAPTLASIVKKPHVPIRLKPRVILEGRFLNPPCCPLTGARRRPQPAVRGGQEARARATRQAVVRRPQLVQIRDDGSSMVRLEYDPSITHTTLVVALEPHAERLWSSTHPH